MTMNQAIQYSYMAPKILKELNLSKRRLICKKIERHLHQIYIKCPQSEERDRLAFQYKHAIKLMFKN